MRVDLIKAWLEMGQPRNWTIGAYAHILVPKSDEDIECYLWETGKQYSHIDWKGSRTYVISPAGLTLADVEQLCRLGQVVTVPAIYQDVRPAFDLTFEQFMERGLADATSGASAHSKDPAQVP